MPTKAELIQRIQNYTTQPKQVFYQGPTTYRGHEINSRHSLRRVSRTILKQLIKSQFCSVNIVGIAGSGKTTLAVNLCTDIIEQAAKEFKLNYSFEWWGRDELKNLGRHINDLPKGQNHIRVCDDVSGALRQLPPKEQEEVFNDLTTTRHTIGGHLLFINLYHYTYSNLKSVKSQAIINIYTSISVIEKLNILAMIGKDPASVQRLNAFMKVYSQSIENDQFELKISPNQKKVFKDWDPFHVCFVISVFKCHLSLFMRLKDSPLWPKERERLSLPAKELLEMGRKSYGRDFDHAVKLLAAQHGYFNKDNQTFARAWNFLLRLKIKYNFIWPDIMNEFNAKQIRRIQKNRKIEQEMDEAFKKIAYYEPPEIKEPEKINNTEEEKKTDEI